MEIQVFWLVTPPKSWTAWPEDDGTSTLQNFSNHYPAHTEKHPRRLESSRDLLVSPVSQPRFKKHLLKMSARLPRIMTLVFTGISSLAVKVLKYYLRIGYDYLLPAITFTSVIDIW
jgi:hypothetical protein